MLPDSFLNFQYLVAKVNEYELTVTFVFHREDGKIPTLGIEGICSKLTQNEKLENNNRVVYSRKIQLHSACETKSTQALNHVNAKVQ